MKNAMLSITQFAVFVLLGGVYFVLMASTANARTNCTPLHRTDPIDLVQKGDSPGDIVSIHKVRMSAEVPLTELLSRGMNTFPFKAYCFSYT